MKRIAWYYYMASGYLIGQISVVINSLTHDDLYLPSFLSWVDAVIWGLFFIGVFLIMASVIVCYYQVLGKGAKGEEGCEKESRTQKC